MFDREIAEKLKLDNSRFGLRQYRYYFQDIMKYLIIGNRGQLGSEFERDLAALGAKFAGCDLPETDASSPSIVAELFDAEKPDIVINCAAYNFVDKAESDFNEAYNANALAPKYLAEECGKRGVKLVHYSTDYVFDGKKQSGLYTEDDFPNPLNKYAETKLSGENFVREILPSALILRVSWVFGRGRQNFIFKLKSWAENQEYLRIACDEFSVPTYTGDIVRATFKALETDLSGTFHYANDGYCSRFEWAREIVKLIKINKFIYPCSMNDFNLPAVRPGFSAMSAERFERTTGFANRSWQSVLAEFIKQSKYD